ncbi:MAG: hypothetical protein ACYSWW_27420 [Planctomycetota bacterium]
MAKSNTLTVGKWRRLQQTAGPRGTFAVAAVDSPRPASPFAGNRIARRQIK